MAKEWTNGFYTSARWERTRQSYIASVKGLCEVCKANGVYTPGYILHHKIELTPENIDDPEITLNWGNLQYVCQDCHNKIHHKSSATREGLVFDSAGNIVKSPG